MNAFYKRGWENERGGVNKDIPLRFNNKDYREQRNKTKYYQFFLNLIRTKRTVLWECLFLMKYSLPMPSMELFFL